MTVKIKKLDPRAVIPEYKTPGSAACDLCALIDGPLTLAPGERALVPTGLAISIPDKNTVALICARSGNAVKRGLNMSNGIGVIDSDYRGELKIPLSNTDSSPQTINPGERIAQLMFMPVLLPDFVESDTLDDTERGEGGFGSTGV